jgi:hypothetical protein
LAVGLTDCVPPVAARLYELPSVPVIVTCVAFVATTVSVEDVPAVIVLGLALIVTVGVAAVPIVTVAVAVALPLALVAVEV